MNILAAYESIHARFAAVSTRSEAFDSASQCAHQIGFPFLIYAPVRNHPDANRNWSSTTYPADWQSIYIQKGHLRKNPARHKALVSVRPFTWSELERELSKTDREVFHDCRSSGMRDGFVIPVHGPGGRSIAIGFACKNEDAIDPDSRAVLHLLATRLYQAFDDPVDAESIRLTRREKELLQFIADGMGNERIAQKLVISDNSVEWHLKNIFRKLGVNNRTGAVVKAMKLGLIPF